MCHKAAQGVLTAALTSVMPGRCSTAATWRSWSVPERKSASLHELISHKQPSLPKPAHLGRKGPDDHRSERVTGSSYRTGGSLQGL